MTEDVELIDSPLARTYSAEGHSVSIEIYRSPGSPWVLEVVDELGTSTVWDEEFETDEAALEAALAAIEEEGIASFVTHARQAAKEAEPELLRKLSAVASPSPLDDRFNTMIGPLSDEELQELDRFLLDLDAEESMTLDMLDGFLHALAIGPETVMPSRWLPKVWGQGDGGMLPSAGDEKQLERALGLVMRHFNSIVFGFGQRRPFVEPLWGTTRYDGLGEFEDAEMWAHGFCEGMNLDRAAWQPLLGDPQGARWYRPIGLLGEDGFSPDQDELTATPEQRQALAREIEGSLKTIHAYWLPLRSAVAEREQARRMGKKVGRNEPCPCGSGKKFKKCCGAASELH
ncbi:MAG TPA: UPF0149 family protein [Candidatus Desulfobacillus denitrificans]|nr:UPF0149 family protein [Candidatus Desulfobacillus denitrificans]